MEESVKAEEMPIIQTRPPVTEAEKAAAARSRFYSALAECFRYPEAEFREGALRGGIGDAFRRLAAALPYPFPWEPADERALRPPSRVTEEDLEVEFVRLFEAGPGGPPCPLVEGAWREDRKVVFKDLILFYNHFGLSYADGAQDERPDHICLEMEFLHYLTFKEVHALQTGADPAAYRRAERDFLERHPLGWVGKALERVERICDGFPEDGCREAVLFYRALLGLALRYFERERVYIQGLLAP